MAEKKTLLPLGKTVHVRIEIEKSKIELAGEAAANSDKAHAYVVSVGPDVKGIEPGMEVILDPFVPHFTLNEHDFGKHNWLIDSEGIKAILK